jgi:ribosomal protein S27AE
VTGVVFVLLANTGCSACGKGVQMAAYAALLHMPNGSD